MGSAEQFLATFGRQVSEDAAFDDVEPAGNPLDTFMGKFGGPPMTSYWFYNGTVEIRFDPVDHVYYRVEELGNLTALLNVSTVSKIVDRSVALIPWCAKVTVEKMLRTIPTQTISTGLDDPSPLIIVPSMTLAEFTAIALQAKTAHKDKLEDAGEVGHEAHGWIERYIKAKLSNSEAELKNLLSERCVDERATKATTAMLAWEKAHNVRWIATEQKCYSKKHDCSGTLDGTALVDSCNDPTCCRVSFKDHLSLVDWKTSNYMYSEFLYQTAAYQGFRLEEFPDVLIVDRWITRLGKDDAEYDPWYMSASDYADDYEGFLACLALKRIVIKAEERLKVQKQGVRAAKKAAKESAKELAIAAAKVAKAEEKAKAKIMKEEEKKRVMAEAKARREAAKAEAKCLKEEQKLLRPEVMAHAEVSIEKNHELLKMLATPTDAELKKALQRGPCFMEEESVNLKLEIPTE